MVFRSAFSSVSVRGREGVTEGGREEEREGGREGERRGMRGEEGGELIPHLQLILIKDTEEIVWNEVIQSCMGEWRNEIQTLVLTGT